MTPASWMATGRVWICRHSQKGSENLEEKRTVVVCVFAVIALGISIWFYIYHNQKSNDNLPALSLIAEMEEADVNELLAGYRRAPLRTVWEEPAFTNTNSDIWEIGGKTTLEVSYNNHEKVVVIPCAIIFSILSAIICFVGVKMEAI